MPTNLTAPAPSCWGGLSFLKFISGTKPAEPWLHLTSIAEIVWWAQFRETETMACMFPRPLTLTAATRFIRTDRRGVARHAVLEDPEFCIVLLFERPADGWCRCLRLALFPCIHVIGRGTSRTFNVSPTVVDTLMRRHWVEATWLARGRNEKELVLSAAGKRAVVEQLCSDATPEDLLHAKTTRPR